MLEKNDRILYFLLGCIGMRTILAILPIYLPYNWLQLFSLPIFLIGAYFLYLYFTDGRLNAPEGGGNTWWANYRLLHGRTSFDSKDGERFLQGCYIDYDSTEGKLKHLARKFGL